MIGVRSLRPFAERRPLGPSEAHCELCGTGIADRHDHVVELGIHAVRCTCRPCALLFSRSDSTGRFRTVPDRVLVDPELAMTPEEWAGLGIPVALAFFTRTRDGITVSYPGPAGVTDGGVDPVAWDAMVAATSLAQQLASDVEALLIHGPRGARRLSCYLVPITRAYELAGRLRARWRGFSGGDEARAELAAFFADLDKGARR